MYDNALPTESPLPLSGIPAVVEEKQNIFAKVLLFLPLMADMQASSSTDSEYAVSK